MKDVKRFGIATPRVDALVTDRSILQHPFIVMEYISGGTLETRIGSDGVSQWLDPMLEVLVRIHDVPWVELLPEPERPVPRQDEPLVYVGGCWKRWILSLNDTALTDSNPLWAGFVNGRPWDPRPTRCSSITITTPRISSLEKTRWWLSIGPSQRSAIIEWIWPGPFCC